MRAPAEDYPPAPVPPRPTPRTLRDSAALCRACDLWQGATQVVIGEGDNHAQVMLVGEQPGDQEDIQGRPFVGPAGGVLERGLVLAGIEREQAYVTNVVKHFRYQARGKRRIHQRPDRWQVSACLPWLEAEVAMVHPHALVCLGATAAQALLGSQVRIGRDRGQPMDSELAELVTVTTHPSAILRTRGDPERRTAMNEFVADLSDVASWLSAR